MKKLLSMLLALSLMTSFGLALAEAKTLYLQSVSGDGEKWINAADVNISMSFILGDDKSVSIVQDGEEKGKGTWDEKDGVLLLTIEGQTVEVKPIEGIKEYLIDMPGDMMKLSEEAPVAFTLPAIVQAKDVAEFDGEYQMLGMGMKDAEGVIQGMSIESVKNMGMDSLLGSFLETPLKLEKGTMTVGEAVTALTLKDGKLVKAEGEDAFEICLTENGVCLTVEMDGLLYFTKAEQK